MWTKWPRTFHTDGAIHHGPVTQLTSLLFQVTTGLLRIRLPDRWIRCCTTEQVIRSANDPYVQAADLTEWAGKADGSGALCTAKPNNVVVAKFFFVVTSSASPCLNFVDLATPAPHLVGAHNIQPLFS